VEPMEPMTTGADSHRATSTVVGAAALVLDRLAPSGRPSELRDVAVGAAFGVEDAVSRMLARARRAAAVRRQLAIVRATAFVAETRLRVGRLADRGAVEQDRGRQRATETVNTLVDKVATAPVVDRVVDAQLDRVVRPLVTAILDDVFALLEAEPERVQALMRGQRDSMVDEMVARIRTGAATGDAAVDRLATRILRRTAEESAAETPTSGPP
jgi:hypothetical protein